jgi:DNA-binding GntR family transcriptional regulator
MNDIDEPLARAQQTREIIKRLRTDIILGKYQAGTRLIESKVADDLGTSRAPVRTAFQLLAQDGLVINLANGGTQIVGFSIKNANDLFDLRYLLERRAIELILNNTSFNFRPLIESMEKLEEPMINDEKTELSSSETSQLDINFHRSILIMSQNYPLLVAWNTLANVMQTILEITNMSCSSYEEFFNGHRKLANFIIQRSQSSLDDLEEHLFNAKRVIIQRLQEKQ